MKKSIKNVDAIGYKLRLALMRVINNKLEIFKENRQKQKEVKERQKAKTIAAKQRRVQKRQSLFKKKM